MHPSKYKTTATSFAISFLCAKRMGAQVVLHTDRLGYALLQNIPYDEVYIYLDEMPEKYAHFWAAGKLYATAREPLHSIHIDGDVFLRDTNLLKLLQQECDLLVQSEENEDWRIDKTYTITQDCFASIDSTPFNIRYPKSYNCGVTCFHNQELKNRYLQHYFDFVEKCTSSEEFLQAIKERHTEGSVIPDIIVEQQFLHELAKEYKVGLILEGDIKQDALDKGYTHVCTSYKYGVQDELNRLLQYYNPELLKAIEENPIIQQTKLISTIQ